MNLPFPRDRDCRALRRFVAAQSLQIGINEEGDATAYVDPEFEEGDYAAILGGELFPNQMLVVWVGGKGKHSMSLNGDAAVPDWWGGLLRRRQMPRHSEFSDRDVFQLYVLRGR